LWGGFVERRQSVLGHCLCASDAKDWIYATSLNIPYMRC
jgi:hypothetical protein